MKVWTTWVGKFTWMCSVSGVLEYSSTWIGRSRRNSIFVRTVRLSYKCFSEYMIIPETVAIVSHLLRCQLLLKCHRSTSIVISHDMAYPGIDIPKIAIVLEYSSTRVLGYMSKYQYYVNSRQGGVQRDNSGMNCPFVPPPRTLHIYATSSKIPIL